MTGQGQSGERSGESQAQAAPPRPGFLTFYRILEKWVQEGSGGAMIQPQPGKQDQGTMSTTHISH
jgi:hypothetical protein